MTKREKIINYLAENGIDILAHEIKNSRYAKSGTIVIKGYNSYGEKFLHEISVRFTGWDSVSGKKRPLEIKEPYCKDIWGNIDWFHHDSTEVRLTWVVD